MSDDTLGKHSKRLHPPRTFARAYELGSADETLSWLRAQTCVVRVPVVMRREPIWPSFSRRGARIGELELQLDDTRLGIAIDDHARRCCGAAPTCALWIEGRLGEHEDGSLAFEIVEFHRAIEPDETATFVEVEVDAASGPT